MANRAGWGKATEDLAGVRWDSVLDDFLKEIGGNQEYIMSMEKLGVQNSSKRKDSNEEKASRSKTRWKGENI